MTDATRDPGFFTQSLSERDPELFGAITDELGRQRDEIELIASENIVSAAVMEAQGSVLTNKYAEGIQAVATMVAANMSTWRKTLPSTVPSSCSTANLPMQPTLVASNWACFRR